MSMREKYVFDLDNTLVYTDDLNNEAYNFALTTLGKKPLNNLSRITRDTVFMQISFSKEKREQLINIKQNYFRENLHKITPNFTLIKVLDSLNKEDCLLWTSAAQCRVEAILQYFHLKNKFKDVFFSTKSDLKRDIERICAYLLCKKEQLRIYDDNKQLLQEINNILFNAN